MDLKKHKEIMIKIANNLKNENVEAIQYYYSEIGDGVLEKIKTPINLIQALEHQNVLGVGNYDTFIKLLERIGRSDLVKEYFDKLFSENKKIIIERRIPYGCIFKYDSHDLEICTKVEFQLYNEQDNWCCLSNKKNSYGYYLAYRKENMLYIKVQNLFYENQSINFRFSFQNENSKCSENEVFQICSADIIIGNCKYELSYNSFMIATPEPIFNNDFSKNLRTPSSLDWREVNNIVIDKVPYNHQSKDYEPIELFALNYIARNFPDSREVICINPSLADKDPVTLVINKFYEFFSATKLGICAILPGYHLLFHASLLKCNVESFGNYNDDNRIIVFYSNLSLVLIARISYSLDFINLESKNCLNDITLFVNVNKPLIENKELIIIGIVVIPLFDRSFTKEKLFLYFADNFDLKTILFLCKDDIENGSNFENWWRSVVEYCIKKNIKHCEDNKVLFKQLIGLTMMVMAKIDHCLPTIELNSQKQIKSLILTYEQWVAIHDKKLKKIISGGYGSGKSVVGKEIVKSCITKMSENPLTLYYICCNHFSLFECEMKEFVDSIEKTSNCTVVCDNLYELWKAMCMSKGIDEEFISISKLLEYLVVTGNNRVYFVLEELSAEYINEEEAVKINILLSSLLKDSLVVFIPESVEKYRELIRNDEKNLIQKNCFHELHMKIFTLNKSMRVTNCNKFLIDFFQESISRSKTVLNFPNSFLDSKITLEKKPKSNVPNSNSYTSAINSNFDLNKSEIKDDKAIDNNCDGITNNFHDLDLDHMFKNLLDRNNNLDQRTSLESSYTFKIGTLGHSIEGKKPQVIFLPFHNITKISSVKVLSIVLEKLCFKKFQKTVVICSNIEELQSVAYATDLIEYYKAVVYAPHMQKYIPTFKKKLKIENNLKTCYDILVTDCKGFSGEESESVIVLVSPEEIYLRHVLVDAMSRCNSYLIVLVLGSKDNTDKKVILNNNETIGDILINLPEEIVQKIKVEIKNDELQQSNSNFYINDQSEDYFNRGSEEDFNKIKNKTCFTIFTENCSIYNRMAFELVKLSEKKLQHYVDVLKLMNESINTYKLKKLLVLAITAYGKVYLCEDENSGKKLVMKCINTGYTGDNAVEIKEVKILKNEISLLKTLHHERIIKYYDSLFTGKKFSVLMEFMEGGSLYDKISREGALDEKTASEKSYQILCGLSYLHSKNIVHRDIKSANILLDLYGNCKLGDFGISKQIETIRSYAGCKTTSGTAYWMSPEVINASLTDIEYGVKADIWSFGCTVLEMLTTKPPWSNFEPMAAMFHIATNATIPHLPDKCSISCKEFVNDCLIRDPVLRPSASQLLTYEWVKR